MYGRHEAVATTHSRRFECKPSFTIHHSNTQLTLRHLCKVSGIWFQPEQHPPSDRMMHAVNGEDEELILTIRGILCSSTLPPLPHDRRYVISYRRLRRVVTCLRFRFSRLPAAIRNLRQYVQVTGLGLPEFDSAVDKIRQIQDLYESSNAAYTVKDVEFTAYEGNKTIEAHARYFTDRYLMPAEKSIPFSRLVDPNGALAKLKPDSFIHGPDNVVEYCKLVEPRDDGKHRCAHSPLFGRVNGEILTTPSPPQIRTVRSANFQGWRHCGGCIYLHRYTL